MLSSIFLSKILTDYDPNFLDERNIELLLKFAEEKNLEKNIRPDDTSNKNGDTKEGVTEKENENHHDYGGEYRRLTQQSLPFQRS